LHASQLALRGLLALAALLVASCGPEQANRELGLSGLEQEIQDRFPSVRGISTAELAAWLEGPNLSRPLVLDVRAWEEFSVSHLPGAVHAPTAAKAIEVVSAHTNAIPAVVYCSLGYRSAELVDQLQALGFTNLFNLEGSIFRWANEGRPLFRGTTLVKGVHPFDEEWGRYLDRDRWSFEAR
jgi:rhodanese-related sulfurtransferase